MSLFVIVTLSLLEDTHAAGLSEYKKVCADIGFNPKAEKFSECVLKIRDRDKAKSAVTSQNKITNHL